MSPHGSPQPRVPIEIGWLCLVHMPKILLMAEQYHRNNLMKEQQLMTGQQSGIEVDKGFQGLQAEHTIV